MSLLSEKHIIKSLQQFSEIPSEKCWESIAQNLPPVSPTSTGNTNVDPSSANQSLSQFFSGVAGKITTIATTAIIATSVGLIYYFNSENEPKNENISKTEIVQTTEDQAVETRETSVLENLPVEKNISEKKDNIPVENKIEVDNKKNIREQKNIIKKKTTKNQTSQIEKQIKKDSLSPNTSIHQTKTSTKTTVQKQETTNQNTIVKEEPAVFEETSVSEISENSNETQPTVAISNIIEKLDVSQIEVPNVFTPNNDGYNDYFVFKNIENFPKNRLIIVNSKGSKVYERYQYDNTWDAPNLPDGSYFYILEISDGNLSSTIQGVVQVLR